MALERKHKLIIGLGVTALILLSKIFYITIINDKYKRDASNNSLYYEYVYPPRGVIYDRNGEQLVTNKICYDILVTPREVGPFDTLALANALDTSPEYVREKMAYYRKYRTRIGYQTQVFMKQVSQLTYQKFAEEQYRYPGFKAQSRTIRDYPFNAGGNLLGYISEVDPEFLKKHPDEYRSGDYVGKTGLEAAREADLKGQRGWHIYLRDSRNRVQEPYQNGEYDVEATPGHNIVTTIDAHLQQYGQELMQGKTGSVVAIEPSTGEILAMVSSPGIDVDVLADISKHYSTIAKDPRKPMFNRTVMASYPPGSVFKLINGMIGLQEGVIDMYDKFPCDRGYPYSKGRKLGCHGHASPLALMDAIATSCNGYFCYVFRRVLENRKYKNIQEAFDKWREYVLSFGFGRKLESDVPFELGGNIPTSAYYDRVYRKSWRFPTIVSLSIGQGEIGATPLQIANLAAIVANRGYYYIPHIVKDSEGVEIEPRFHEKQYTLVDTTHFEKAVQGMYMAVNGGGAAGGTAFSARIPGLDVCGKTGTAQNPHGKDNSVFICFAPKDNPKIAVAAYVENAGFGATWACPVASLMLEKYLNGEICQERKYLEDRILTTRFF
ncbi:MAG: penicillin-binding protein 2 [Bacteroidales bacterium]|nr:penicillin-binding protein 2 [Candidatus Cryptobacteroides equifaecalis]